MKKGRGSIVLALLLIALGGWFLADNLGVPLPGWGVIWPIFPMVFGLAMLTQYASSGGREEGLVFVGTGALLTGAFLFLFTLGVLEWHEMGIYWPVWPLIGGVSFFALYLAGGVRDHEVLIPAFAAGAVGVIAFPFTLGAVDDVFLNRIIKFWPLLLVILGLAFLFRPKERPSRVREVTTLPDEETG